MATALSLNPTSSQPLYRQLYEQLRGQIQSGRLLPGDRIPPTRELAGLLGLNRTTVSAAYELLEKDGFIRGHVGRGSFVQARPEPDQQKYGVESTGTPAVARINFNTSRPSEELFPVEEFRAVTMEVIGGDALGSILQLGSPQGFEPLRRHLLQEASTAGVARASDDLLITSGCQQALDLLQRTFVSTGDLVALEDPVYPGLREVFERAGARLVGFSSPDELEMAARVERPKLVAVTPTFQNPTGRTLRLDERRALLRWTAASGASLVEIDIYTGLRYEGDPLASLKQLDPSGNVIQLGSFSKMAFPGLRVGWMLAPRAVVQRCSQAKQWCDLHTDHLSQAILLRCAESGLLARHREQVVRAGRERLLAAVAACSESLPAGSLSGLPQGGMNLWVNLPVSIDASELARRAALRGVSFLPGNYFEVLKRHSSSLRLSFAGLRPEVIREGIAILGRLVDEELSSARPGGQLEPAVALV